jgi:hypothetical protein
MKTSGRRAPCCATMVLTSYQAFHVARGKPRPTNTPLSKPSRVMILGSSNFLSRVRFDRTDRFQSMGKKNDILTSVADFTSLHREFPRTPSVRH